MVSDVMTKLILYNNNNMQKLMMILYPDQAPQCKKFKLLRVDDI